MSLPVWFLVLAIFLPRVALFVEWFDQVRFPVPWPGDALLWIFLPRVLVLLMIYTRLGVGTWFWIHLLAAILTYSGGSREVARRR